MEKLIQPVIGILSQNLNKSLILQKYPNISGKPYIVTSYKQYLQAAGAKVLLIDCNVTEETARRIYNSVNGLLLPGGSASLKSSNYARLAKLFHKWAMEDFDNQRRYFPIFGICLGFQFLLRQYEGDENCLSVTETKNVNLAIKFLVDQGHIKKLFSNFTQMDLGVITANNVTFNFHKFSLTVNDLPKHKDIENNFTMLATSFDEKNNTEFIAAIESKYYPFYGLEWHPEKNEFESNDCIDHSADAINCSQRFAEFLRNECCYELNELTESYKDFECRWKTFDTHDVLKSMKEVLVLYED